MRNPRSFQRVLAQSIMLALMVSMHFLPLAPQAFAMVLLSEVDTPLEDSSTNEVRTSSFAAPSGELRVVRRQLRYLRRLDDSTDRSKWNHLSTIATGCSGSVEFLNRSLPLHC